VQRLAAARAHPGRLLHYLPDQPTRDPIAGDGCVPIPTAVARSTRNFRLDSDRQIRRMEQAAVSLNGQLLNSDAEDLLHRLDWSDPIDPLPRELVLELNTSRATRPIFWPARTQPILREPMRLDLAERIFAQIGSAADVRLTLAGVGDPLLHEQVFELIAAAQHAGVRAIHLETDLLPDDPTVIDRLVASGIDVVSVHLPAATAATYAAVMGVDHFAQAIENIRAFVTRRHELGQGVPILVPTFVKCQANLAEMEAWYDQWLRALNAAVIRGPGDFPGLIDDCGVADMSPPKRRACSRLWSRMTMLSDGRVASCEQDPTGQQIVGDVRTQSISEIWQRGLSELRGLHTRGWLSDTRLCAACREWHRP
jgi:organic radical activating enzyme